MTTKHTPGPWRWVDTGYDGWELLGADDEKVIGSAAYEGMYFANFGDEEKADMALVAAAPELLAALRDCMSCMDSLRDYVSEGGSRQMVGAMSAIQDADFAFDAARAAIAKAEGKQ